MTLIGVIASLVGPTVAAMVALRWWRVQTVGKRKTEIAEGALLAMAEAVQAISYIRSPLQLQSDLSPEESAKPSTVIFSHTLSRFTVAHRRILQNRHVFDLLERHRILCRYYFGPEFEAPFKEIEELHHRMLFAARSGEISDGTPPSAEHSKFLDTATKIINSQLDEDEIRAATIAARTELEKLLAPTLSASAWIPWSIRKVLSKRSTNL